MSERWIMNRLGFVNFWLYDVEDFLFENGKLLLRGQNGSGKSITTQSFIPFILDGDKTPSRLDPFGSSDRKMEYYFLGEEGKEESTGYLYLEFYKKSTNEYRTIAIGQRARRGKPMDFWGFIIMDGRRVEYDIYLYDESGSSKIPLGKNEMKKRLGEANIFTESASEYKRMVNKYLFGFARDEQYDQFVRLLVKVRAPKLSKEFKPTKVYEILNDSLQTLSDEDLRPMVDAMEKMDSIQASLEQLQRALSDVKIVRNEYIRYNQFMLGRKAKAYLEAKNGAIRAQAEFEKMKADMEEYEKQKNEKISRKQVVSERITFLQTEIATLLDSSNLEEIDTKLNEAHKDFEEQKKQKSEYQDRNENNKAELRRKETEKKRLEDDNDYKAKSIKDEQDELECLQESIQWMGHRKIEQIIKEQDSERALNIQDEISLYQKAVQKGKESVECYEQEKKQLDAIAEKVEQAKGDYEEKHVAAEYAEQELEKVREAKISMLYKTNAENKVWKLTPPELAGAEQILQEYVVGDGRKLDKVFQDSYFELHKAMDVELLEKKAELNVQQKQFSDFNRQYNEVLEQQDVQPFRSECVERSRKRMEELEIKAIPFYKAVEFDEQLSEVKCAMLESQLMDMGLLDALVVSEQDFQRIQNEFPEMTDHIIRPVSQGTGGFHELKVSDEINSEIKLVVSNILSCISKSPDGKGLELWIQSDGSYGQGILYGRSSQKESAEYVGIMARRRRKECLLQQLQEEIQLVSELIAQSESDIRMMQERLQTLEQEFVSAITTNELEELILEVQSKQLSCDAAQKKYHNLDMEREQKEDRCNQLYQAMLTDCKLFPYGRTSAAYREVLNDIEEYKSVWMKIVRLLEGIKGNHCQILMIQEYIDNLETVIDDLYRDIQNVTQKIKQLEIQINHYEEVLNNPEIKQQAQRLKNLKEESHNLEKEREDLSGDLRVLEDRIEQMEGSEEAKRSEVITKVQKENLLRQYFEEEMALELVFKREAHDLERCAREAVSQVRKADEDRNATDIFTSLHTVFSKYSGNLVSYNTSLEECFGEAEPGSETLRKRYRISSAWNGKKVYFEEFYNILKTTIEETELLIQRKDRELFEDILSKTISQQLTDRIAESRKWVQDMSALMKLDTSMGLYFALDWKPRTAENEQELDVADLEKILSRDKELLTDDDIEKVAAHFRSKIRTEKRLVEDDGLPVNYMDLVRDALDYRKWFAFQMFYYRGMENRKPLTNAAFNKFSGGEKAMAMYAPLFAAVNAQYKKATNAEHPRMIALDEAFAGVDDKNISSMFQLVASMDFDYIMNSQALWGCYESVPALHIAELRRPLNSQTVSVIHYTWNGHERILDEQ